jgi:hypothetical protein
MRKILSALSVLAFALTARAFFPSDAHASMTGYWGRVCCGGQCSPGDYCTGNGSYSCCK